MLYHNLNPELINLFLTPDHVHHERSFFRQINAMFLSFPKNIDICICMHTCSRCTFAGEWMHIRMHNTWQLESAQWYSQHHTKYNVNKNCVLILSAKVLKTNKKRSFMSGHCPIILCLRGYTRKAGSADLVTLQVSHAF